MNRTDVEAWVARYEWVWRTPGTADLADVFTPDIRYLPSPWAQEIVGLDALAVFWESERDGPDEGFSLTVRVLAVDGDLAVVRVEADYATGARWRDLWLVRLDDDNRCTAFEEWPFAPDQRDGH